MLISSLNISNGYTYQVSGRAEIDSVGKLYKAEAPNPTQLGDNNGLASNDVFIYSRLGLEDGKTAPSRAIVLENADGSYFKLDLANSDKVNLVAKGKTIDLFVYRPDSQSAEKFSFTHTGVLTGSSQLDVQSFSQAEISTKRDLDGNGAVGAKLKTSQTSADALKQNASKAAGGILNVSVMGEDIYVVGDKLDRAKQINANTRTLLNSDGSYWKPEQDFETLRAVATSTTTNGVTTTTWDVYGTVAKAAAGDDFAITTKFSFNASNKLVSTSELTAEELVAAEATSKRDLNVDGAYGLAISGSIDNVGGLVKGRLAGQDVLLAKVAGTDSTGGRPVNLDARLIGVDGTSWSLPADADSAGYAIKSIVKSGTNNANASVYATNNGGADVIRFDFTKAANGSYNIVEDTAAGVTVTATEMASAEKTAQRDLNGDSKFGATINSIEDRSTGLYKATMMGESFYLAGNLSGGALRKTGTSGALAQNLGGALLAADGGAWSPASGQTVRALIDTTGSNATRSYSVYTSTAASSSTPAKVQRYDFAADGTTGNFKITAASVGGLEIADAIELAAAEKSTKRDLNNDGIFGASIDNSLDKQVGLYKASLMGQSYFLAGNLAGGSARSTGLTGSLAQNLGGALLNGDGTAWKIPTALSGYTVKSIVSSSSEPKYSIYAVNADKVMRFDFSTDAGNSNGSFKVTNASRAGVAVTAADMAAAEATQQRDLNDDGKFGAEITDTIDRGVGLYQASMMGESFYLAGHQAGGAVRQTAVNGTQAQTLAGALVNADGTAWDVASGYEASALVLTSASNATTTTYSLYAHKTGDKNDVLRFDFASNSAGNFVVTSASEPGVAISADALALKEALLARDLNADDEYGVSITKALDATGGLYAAQALGSTYLLAGANLSSSANGGLDLSKALLDGEGKAWTPDNVADVSANRFTAIAGATAGDLTVYVKNDGSTASYSKYSFQGYKLVGNRQDITTEQLAAAEKANGRDISGDGKYGAVISAAKDLVGGLYQGSLGEHSNVYFKAAPSLALGSLVAGNALDFTSALKDANGYWAGPDSGFTVQTAHTDGTNFVLVATDGNGAVKKYSFETTSNALVDAKSGDVNAFDLAAMEKAKSRDLDRDGIIAVRPDQAAVDSVGGLFKASSSGQSFFVVASTAAGVTDLSTALRDADGNAWAPGNYDRMVLKQTSSGWDAYVKSTASNTTSYTRYSFDSSHKLSATSDPLSDIELADAEADISRDINGDNVIGARITDTISAAISAASGLYSASVNGSDFVLASHDAGGAAVAITTGASGLTGKMLFDETGKAAWSTTGYTLAGATYNLDSGGDVASVYVFAKKDADSSYHRFTFTSEHVLTKSEALSEEQIAAAGLAADPTYSDVDTRGTTDLFKATVLGQDYYVVGQSGGNPVPDLSKALFDDAASIWQPASGFKIGGLVDNTASGGTYDVYTYKLNSAGDAVDEVQKSSWDSDMNFMGTAAADPAALLAVETTAGRDLTGDNVVGFKLTTLDPSLGYRGVSSATIYGSTTYLLAGNDLAQGSANAPLTLDKALLNERGSAPWAIDSGYQIKFVSATSTTRSVYAIKAGSSGAADQALRYYFDLATGKSQGAGVAVSMIQLAALEESGNTDMNGDGRVGAVTISAYSDDSADSSPSFGTDLIKASFGGQTFYAVNTATTGDDKLNLSGMLLKQDGSAWDIPSGFTVKGVYQPSGQPLEIYGLDADGAIKQYRFSENVDSNGQRTTGYTLMDAKVRADGVTNPIRGSDLATTETTAALDLNGDGAIGYRRAAGTTLTSDSGSTSAAGWSLGKAAVSNGSNIDADQIYVVSNDFAAMSSISTSSDTNADNTVAGGALLAADGSYWKPDANYEVKSISYNSTDSQVILWAQGTSSGGDKVYQQYVFEADANGRWGNIASSLTADADYDGDTTNDALSTATLLGEEITATQDLNGDGAVGLIVDDRILTSSGSNIYKAHIDTQNYYVVGTDSSVASGTPSAPADPSGLHVLMADATTRWEPTSGDTTDTWRLANSAETTADANAVYALEINGGSTVVTFDASYTVTVP